MANKKDALFEEALNEEFRKVDEREFVTDDYEEDIWMLDLRTQALREFLGVAQKMYGYSHPTPNKIVEYLMSCRREKDKREKRLANMTESAI